jgi:hypothetical protein
MQILGHIAVALAQDFLIPSKKNRGAIVKPLLIAGLFPDLIDKTIGYIFQLMPNGRHFGHNIFSLIGSSLLVSLIWGRTTGYAWFMGYLGHLLIDSANFVPWFFPFRDYHFEKGRLYFRPVQLLQEALLLVSVLMIRRLAGRRL